MEKAVRVDMLDFDFWTILFSVINILVLFFFLKKFLFGRVNAMLEKRAQMVQADMDEAKQHAADAEKLKNAYEETLSGAKQEAKQIIATAEQNAHAQGSEITAKAQQQADTLLKEAQKEIERERRQTLDGVQDRKTGRDRRSGTGCCFQADGAESGRPDQPRAGERVLV
mgnify:CR=1 FL=1